MALAVALAVACSGADAPASDPPRSTGPATTDASGTTGPDRSTPGGGGQPELVAPDAEDFYDVPDPLPAGDHGLLLRYQEILPSHHAAARTWRIMYLSESVAGDPIAVTGVAVVPTADPPAAGRPVLTLAHGTTGIADECAPSLIGGGGELALTLGQVDQGWLIVATDYEGLGTPGRHPYLVGPSEGRGVVDAVRAAGLLPDAHAGRRVAIGGYSQGGHGALWAGQVAAEWAPELEVVGTFAGAPATELPLILGIAPRLAIGGFAMMIVAGFAAAYPEADPALVLTEAGLARLDEVDQGCVGEVIAAFAEGAGDLMVPDGPTRQPWATLAADNNPGEVVTAAPILVVHSEADQTVPAALSAALFDRLCGLGQVAERRVTTEGWNHVQAAPDAYAQALAWLADRFAGEPAADGCP